MKDVDESKRRFGRAWVLFALAVALHVADETANDFLSIYNPTVLEIRTHVRWLPLPTFTFAQWIVGLGSAVVLLLALSPRAFSGTEWVRRLALPLGVVIGVLNGAQHLISSFALRRMMPGVCSSPVLIFAGMALLYSARQQFSETQVALP